MENLDEIIKNRMIYSYENNVTFRNQLIHTFNTHYLQNIKYNVLWLFFHSFSFAYPDNPSDEYKIETANFISNVIPKNLGCGGCQNDYKKYIEKLNVFRIVSSNQEISTFFIDLHNYITKSNFDKQTRTVTNFTFTINENETVSPLYCNYAEVETFYKKTDFITLLESKFNINMFKMIENKSLASFYELFNKFDFKTDGRYSVSFEII